MSRRHKQATAACEAAHTSKRRVDVDSGLRCSRSPENRAYPRSNATRTTPASAFRRSVDSSMTLTVIPSSDVTL